MPGQLQDPRPDVPEQRGGKKQLHTLLDALPDPILFFTLDNAVEYINPAFEKVFGWTLDEVRGKNIRFIPDHLVGQARQGLKSLFKHRSVHDFDTQRFTKEGRILDVRLNASLITDDNHMPLGHLMVLRDITEKNRIQKSKQAMFRISQALHSFQELGDLIGMINREIKDLIGVEGTFILLADHTDDHLYFYQARFRNAEADQKFKKIRFPADQGVSGRVFTSGIPIMIPDVSACEFFLKRVDDETDLTTRNMMSVPIRLKDRTIGVVSVVNKHDGEFQTPDMELLSTVAGTIALPIENARIHEELKKSFQEVKALNHAKAKVINHLAHEMKTPVAVLGACLKLMVKRVQASGLDPAPFEKVLDRAQRHLDRILDIQYETEDLLLEKDHTAHGLLVGLADALRDEMVSLVELEALNGLPVQAVDRIRAAVDEFFGPRKARIRSVDLAVFLKKKIQDLEPRFSDRSLGLDLDIQDTGHIMIPLEILEAIIIGLVRNSVEYTPDHGLIKIRLFVEEGFPTLEIRDFGIGFTRDKILLVFEQYFTPPDTPMYATKTPFAFNAGGSGLDLLRMQIFSEKYHFSLDIHSDRCGHIPTEQDICPGNVGRCPFCQSPDDCMASGGTSVVVRFMTSVQKG